MKKLMFIALAGLLFCSCQKVQDFVPPVPGDTTTNVKLTSQPASVENLGNVLSGTNVLWKIHPLNPNLGPLFTYLPYQTSGYCMLMIDCGKMDGRTPLGPFHFVVVNLQDRTSKIVQVVGPEGNPISSSLGRIVRYIFGMDKKFYVCTEGSAGGGGHLIQYDPNTQVAVDLGKPFNTAAGYLDIYSLGVGTDGALYGGSFGGDGQVYTFRYNYSTFQVDTQAWDNTSRYVTAVTGDARFTYIVCGKNNWFLYARDRVSGEQRTLKTNWGTSTPIDVGANVDAAYAHSVATHYKLTGFDMNALTENYTPTTQRVVYAPYSEVDPTVPTVSWDPGTKSVSYSMNGSQGTIQVNGIVDDNYPVCGPYAYYNNKFYFSNDQQGMLGSYSEYEGMRAIGATNMSLHTIAVPCMNGSDAGNIFLGGYPKGTLLQYAVNQNWSVNINDANSAGLATPSTNPAQKVLFQNPDGSGVFGSMILLGSVYTRNCFLATAGNNDRITASSGRELSMGSYRNGVYRNLYLPEFSNYEFQSMCVSKDSNYAFICGVPHAGTNAKLYKYDPAGNTIAGSWDLPLWGDRFTTIYALTNDLVVGICENTLYVFNTAEGQMVLKQSIGLYQKMYGLTVAPDNSVYVVQGGSAPNNFSIVRYYLNVNGGVSLTGLSNVASLTDNENRGAHPNGMMLTPTNKLFITGLNSLYKVNL